MPVWSFFTDYLKRADSTAEVKEREAEKARQVRRNAWVLAGTGRQTKEYKRITQPASSSHPGSGGPPPRAKLPPKG